MLNSWGSLSKYCYYLYTKIFRIILIQLKVVQHKKAALLYFTDQEYYEYVKNLKTLKTSQLTTESIYMESTKQKKSYPSSSLIHDGDTASLFQNIETPNSSHMYVKSINKCKLLYMIW